MIRFIGLANLACIFLSSSFGSAAPACETLFRQNASQNLTIDPHVAELLKTSSRIAVDIELVEQIDRVSLTAEQISYLSEMENLAPGANLGPGETANVLLQFELSKLGREFRFSYFKMSGSPTVEINQKSLEAISTLFSKWVIRISPHDWNAAGTFQ